MRAQLTNRDWYDNGPLGNANYRNQLGRSFNLGDPIGKLRTILIDAGATQHTTDPNLRGLARRAAGDAAASVQQITCSYRTRESDSPTRALTIRGLIEWGTDGHQCQAYFDWVNGSVVQVAGSYVRVIAEVVDVSSTADDLPSHPADTIAVVGAIIGYWGANRLPPTFTQQVRLLQTAPPALPAASIAIPKFARRLWWTGPVLTSAVWALGPGAGQTIAQVDPAGVTPRQPYERPGIATHVQLVGNAGAATLNNLVWELVL